MIDDGPTPNVLDDELELCGAETEVDVDETTGDISLA